METRWMYHTSATFGELRTASRGTCLIPMGCVEKHGLHMALGTDIMIAERVAYMASQLETVAVFPDYIFGDVAERQSEHTEGTLTLPIETHFLLLEQLCDQIYRNGFRKILIYNCHGGNQAWLEAFIRNLDNKEKNYVVAKAFVEEQAPHVMARRILAEGSGAIPELTAEDEALLLRYHKEGMTLGHACFGEGSFIMGIAPETMRLDLLGRESGLSTGESAPYREVGIALKSNGWNLDFPNAFCGHDPYGMNERIGAAALRMEAERLAKALRVFKEDEKLLAMLDK
ncbi:MAG: creatininase family protein [Clostridia bacterium]|nr:creatininase family protein [Clostridia bacterium]